MRYAAVRIVEGVQIVPDGADHCVLTLPGTAIRARLTRPATALLLLADGQHDVETIDQIADALELGAPAGFVESLVGQLADAVLVELRAGVRGPHVLLPGTQHTCESCGRSCEGHMVGPLPSSEAERVQNLYNELKAERPELGAHKPFTRLGGDLFLTTHNGRCIFLADDRRCALHARYGAASKPSICQMFPFVRVQTEEGTRLVIKPDCARHHRHLVRAVGQPEVAIPDDPRWPELPESSPVLYRKVGAPGPLAVGREAATADFRAQEAAMIEYLGSEGATVAGAVALMRGGAPPDTPPSDSGALSTRAVRTVGKAIGRLRAPMGRRGSFVADVLELEGGLGDDFRALRRRIRTMSSGASRFAAVPYVRDDEIYLLDCLRRHFFARESLQFRGPGAAVATMLCGWTLALWSANRDGLEGDERFDAVCERLVAWNRLATTSELHASLFRTERDVDQVLGAVVE